MVKVRLLNDGGYFGMESVSFPAEVIGEIEGAGVKVTGEELIKIEACSDAFYPDFSYTFTLCDECEVIHD